jgi:hypothetical protein
MHAAMVAQLVHRPGCLAPDSVVTLHENQVVSSAGVLCLSALSDLIFSGETFRTLAEGEAEARLPSSQADPVAFTYLAGHPAQDYRCQPAFYTLFIRRVRMICRREHNNRPR